jgi:hypothetical protein
VKPKSTGSHLACTESANAEEPNAQGKNMEKVATWLVSKAYGHQSVIFTSFDVLRVCGRRELLTVGDQVSIQATENVDYHTGVGSRGPVHREIALRYLIGGNR